MADTTTVKKFDYYGKQIYFDPTSHADSTNIYGLGNSTLYGHLKLSDSLDGSGVDTSSATAATPKAVYDSRKPSNLLEKASGALYAESTTGTPKFGTLPIAQGGTGATALTTSIGPSSGTGAATNTQVPSALAVRNAINSGIANPNVSNATGTLAVSHGGTGATTLTSNAVITGNGTGNVKTVSTSSGALYATAANAAPQFGTLPVAQGGTGFTTSTNKNAVVIGNSSTATNALQTVRTGNGAFYATAQDGAPQFGTLPVGQGGSGATTLTSNAVITGNGTGAVKTVTSGNGALYATAANAAPQFGTLPIAQGGTGATALTTSIGPSTGTGAATNTQVPSALAVRNAVNSAIANPNVSNATGTLAVSHGGTGATTLTDGYALIGKGTAAVDTRQIKSTLSGTTAGLSDTSLATIGAVSTHASKAASQTVSGHVKVYVDGTTLVITGTTSI